MSDDPRKSKKMKPKQKYLSRKSIKNQKKCTSASKKQQVENNSLNEKKKERENKSALSSLFSSIGNTLSNFL